MKTIVVLDDHELICDALEARLRKQYIVHTAHTADLASALIRKGNIVAAIVDLSLPGRSGYDLIEEISFAVPSCKLIALSMYHKIQQVVAAFQSGCHGFVSKEAPSSHIEIALSTVLSGKYYIDDTIASEIVAILRREGVIPEDICVKTDGKLTTREIEVLKLLAKGNSPKTIACKLSISINTVEMHQTNIYKKLGFEREAQLVIYALQRNLITLPE